MEKIKARIQKLLVLAEESENQNEARSAMSKAIKLMSKYQIEQGQITEQEATEVMHIHSQIKLSHWQHVLLHRIGATLGVYAVWLQGNGGSIEQSLARYWLTGTKADVELTKYVFDVITININVRAQEYKRKWGLSTKETNDYKLGLATGFSRKFKDENTRVAPEAIGKGLIPVDTRLTVAKEQYLVNHSQPRTVRKKTRNSDALHNGIRDGKELTVNKGVTGKKAPKALSNFFD